MNHSIDRMHMLVLHIGMKHCRNDWNYKNICSPFTRIYYITSGQAQIELPDKLQDLRPGHMYIIPAFTPHSYICKEEFGHYYIHIYNESGTDILEDWELPTEIQAKKEDLAHIKRLYELCPEMELIQNDPQFYDNNPSLMRNIRKNKQRDLYARIESRGIIFLLLARFMRTAHPKTYIHDERITKVLNHIRTHICEKPNIDVLADISCLSKDHLIRLFKKEIKITPLFYINKKKIEYAQLKLVTENVPVKEIAYQLGFDDQSYFNRLFRKMTGYTPMKYRKAYEHQE